jgi:hypothetical protein
MNYIFCFNFAYNIFVFYLFFHIYAHVSLPLAHPIYPFHGSPHVGWLKEVLL